MRFTQFSISLIVAPFACLCAQLAAAAVTVQQTNFGEESVVQPTTEIRLQVDRLPAAEEGRIAIFIGRTDVTSQFRIDGTELIYQPTIFPLPAGESQVTVYLVKGDEWQEIAQLPLKVARQTPASKPVTSAPTSGEPESSTQPLPEIVPKSSQTPIPGQSETSASDLMQPSTEPPKVDPSAQPVGPRSPEQTVEQSAEQSAEAEKPQEQTAPEQIPESSEESAEESAEESSEQSSEQSPERTEQSPAESTSPESHAESSSAESPEGEAGSAASGFSFSFKPRINTTIKSQFRENRSQDAGVPERPTFTDATTESGFESELKWGEFTLQSRASFLGVTFQPEALRFGELQEAAPQFDLSEYQMDAIWGPLQFSMGHQCYGNHPFLLDNFCSRGMTLKAKLSDRIDVSVNSMSATSIVGFSNFSGLNDFNNNITAATLGIQAVKNNFGGIRLEATMMSGERKPIGDFNEGEVIDAEKSRGFGFRLFGSDNSGRLRFDVGYARSRFTNPPDPQLTGGEEIEEPPIDEGVDEDPIIEVPDEENPVNEEPINEIPDEEPSSEEPINEEPVSEEPINEEPINEEPVSENQIDEVEQNPGNEIENGNDPTDEIVDEPITEIPDEENPIDEDGGEEPTDEVPDNGENEGELQVVPVEPVIREAIYAEVSYDLLRDVKIGSNHTLSFTLNVRHERIEPQFQTLGASVTADKLRNLVGFNATIAGATVQFQHEWFEDNLANVPTVLKTKTRNTALNVNIPLQTVLESKSQFLPTLNYSYQRVHQFGANFPIPELSGFDETEIPDQLNVQHQLGAQWSFDNLSLNYQFSSSSQDNRQPSRENADFHNLTHQISLSWQLSPRFQLSVGYNWSNAKSIEEGITRFSASPTIGFSWEFLKGATLAVNFSRNDNFDSLNQSFTRGDGLEAVLTWNFNINTGAGLQLPVSAFLRYSRQSTITRDNVFDLSNDSTIEIINGGLSFSF